jgi:CBS domain-containing protein
MTPKIVEDVMSRDLVYMSEDSHLKLALPQILRFGITAVPVLDSAHRPIGVVSLRDVVSGSEPADAMTSPAHVISSKATIDEAARALAATDIHHFVVVDGGGRAVGMVSSLDLLRALVGAPARHPAALSDVPARA